MRRIGILLTFILFANLIIAQSPPIQLKLGLGDSADNEGTSIVQTKDGGYVVSSNNRLYKLDYQFVVQWNVVLNGDYASFFQQTSDEGFIVAGHSRGNNFIKDNKGGIDFWVVKLNSTGVIEWEKSYGGSRDDIANKIRQTSDGGYIVVGSTESIDGDLTRWRTEKQIWVVKLNQNGVLQWQKAIGNEYRTNAYDVMQNLNGDFIIVGEILNASSVSDLYITGIFSNGSGGDGGTSFNNIGNDGARSVQYTPDGGCIVVGYANSGHMWILKLKSDSSIEWQKTISSTNSMIANKVHLTSDGGYIIVSINGDVLKLNTTGSIIWQEKIQGYFKDIIQNKNGDYILVGSSTSANNYGIVNYGGKDIWIVMLGNADYLKPIINLTDKSELWIARGSKSFVEPGYKATDNFDGVITNKVVVSGIVNFNVVGTYNLTYSVTDWAGNISDPVTRTYNVFENNPPNIEWSKGFNAGTNARANSIKQTADGGYIVVGRSTTYYSNPYGGKGGEDFIVFKLKSSREIEWFKIFGGTGHEAAESVIQTSDGGYLVAGTTDSTNGDVAGLRGSSDFWVLKLTAEGDIQWPKTYGGSNFDSVYNVLQTKDNGYLIFGYSESNNGDLSNLGYSGNWLVKINSNGILQWQKKYLSGRNPYYMKDGITETNDGDFIFSSYSSENTPTSYNDFGYGFTKISNEGVLIWRKNISKYSSATVSDLSITKDGGFIVTGYTSFSSNANKLWVAKFNSNGVLIWDNEFGGSKVELSYAVKELNDGGFVIAGSSDSTDGDLVYNKGKKDIWLIKVNNTGNIQWYKSIGGSRDDEAYDMQITDDEGILIAGRSTSGDGDMNDVNKMFWLAKLSYNEENPFNNIPSSNFKFQAITSSCPSQNNGKIIISANKFEDYLYYFSLNGTTTYFTQGDITIDNLAPKKYTICFKILLKGDFTQCYEFEILGTPGLSGRTTIESTFDKTNANIEIDTGTAPYFIVVNGKIVEITNNKSVSVSVQNGDLLVIKSSVSCEGNLSERVLLLNELTAYPNPTSDYVEVFIPTTYQKSSVMVQIVNNIGKTVLSKEFKLKGNKIVIPLEQFATGLYMLNVLLDIPQTIKVIKK